MKRLLTTLAALTAMVTGSAAFAERTYEFPGALCQQNSGITPVYDQYGVHNPSSGFTTGGYVDCPLAMSFPEFSSAGVDEIRIFYYNRSSSPVLSCNVLAEDGFGNVIYQTGLLSAPSAQLAGQTFDVSLPAGAAMIAGFWRMSCFLPTPASLGVSHLVGAIFLVNQQ